MKPAQGWKKRGAVLEDMNAEAVKLAAAIKKNFEELGI